MKIKALKKKSTALPLQERTIHRLEGGFKKEWRKVALEPDG